MKAQSEYRNYSTRFNSLKDLSTKSAKQEFKKNCKIVKRAFVMKYNFNKIADLEYTFARITLHQLISFNLLDIT